MSIDTAPPGPDPAPPPPPADDLPPSARAMISLLSSSLDRQARIAEQNADRVAALGDRVDAMGEKVSTEIGAAMRHQTKVLSALVLIALVLLGGAAGVSFMGDGFGVAIRTAAPDLASAEGVVLDEIEPIEVVSEKAAVESAEVAEPDSEDGDPGGTAAVETGTVRRID